MKTRYVLIFSLIISCAGPVFAAEKLSSGGACSSDANVLDWDTVWQCVSSVWARAALFIGTTTDSCDASHAGKLKYNTGTLQFCNGASWQSLLTNTVTPSVVSNPGTGYFVLTSTSYDGMLGTKNAPNVGYYGANQSCLTELTTNTTWKGYATANANGQLVSGRVYAFLSNVELLPNTTYTFAHVGDASAGGGTFTTDGSGVGPNDSANWSGASYFNGSFSYWNGGRQIGTATAWGTAANGSANCLAKAAFDTNSNAATTSSGTSNSTGTSRWYTGSTNNTCNQTFPLVCVVDPP